MRRTDRLGGRGRHACELATLEARRMLAATLDGRLWRVEGERIADSIVIEADPVRANRVRAVVNGVAVASVNVKEIDTIHVSGGDGADRVLVKLGERFAGLRVRVDGNAGDDTLLGGAGRDELRGGRGNDVLDGGAGADVLRGELGHDELAGDDGDDQLRGDAGADTLAGGWGRDNVSGGTDADQLRGGADGDFLYGNDGPDTLAGGDGRDRLLGGGDRDRLFRESPRDQLVGSSNEMREAGDDDGAVRRMTSRDEWAQQIIDAGLRAHAGQFGRVGFGWLNIDTLGDRWGDGGAQGGGNLLATTWSVLQTSTGAVRVSSADAAAFAANNVTSDADQKFSRTNNQVAGVEESDIVQTDGRYIYSLSNGKLVITDVSDARSLRVASTTSLGENRHSSDMYLQGTRLTIITSYFEQDPRNEQPDDVERPGLTWAIDWQPGKQRTEVATWDVSDPAAPSKLAVATVDGAYQSSRLIDGRLALVVNNGMAIAYPRSVFVDEQWRTETEAEYADRVRDEVRAFAPKVNLTRAGRTSERDLIDTGDVYLPAEPDADVAQLTTVAIIDTADTSAGPVSSATYAGTGGTTYASRDALYVVNNSWSDDAPSKVIKFGLDGTNVSVEATGSFTGRVNNQFSLDEHGEHFRLAYSTNGLVGTPSTNGVIVFNQVGDQLSAVGKLEGLAEGEQIFAARFVGDEAYLVTFEQKDPLFTIDLSDPTKPAVVGELVIPGFSRFLHPLDENHLIGVGRNADENGFAQELQLSLFDITDRANPRRIDTISFGEQDADWSSSMAEWDHRAFQYNAEAGVILLPVDSSEDPRLELIRVDADTGFERIGSVASDASYLTRGVWIGPTVFAVGNTTIRAADIQTAATYDEVDFA